MIIDDNQNNNNDIQVQPALHILLLLLWAPLLQGFPIENNNNNKNNNNNSIQLTQGLSQNPTGQAHQIFRNPLKTPADIHISIPQRKLTTPFSKTRILLDSEKTKQGSKHSTTRRRFENKEGQRYESTGTVFDETLPPCLPVPDEKKSGGEPFR